MRWIGLQDILNPKSRDDERLLQSPGVRGWRRQLRSDPGGQP